MQSSEPVDVKTLQPDQARIGADMAALGILYPTQVGDQLFLCPTFMAEMLAGGRRAASGSSIAGFIVVETSFRVYAYTICPVQVSSSRTPLCIATAQEHCLLSIHHTVLCSLCIGYLLDVLFSL